MNFIAVNFRFFRDTWHLKQKQNSLHQKHMPLVNYPLLLFLNGPSENTVANTCLVVGQV